MIHGTSDEGGRMKTDHTTHLAMSVNGSPLGLWVPHSVQEAQAFDVPYSDTPLSVVSESSFLGHGSSRCCFQRQVFGHHCQGPGPLPCITLPFWNVCHAPSQLNPGEPSHTHIHLTTDRDSTQLNAPPCMGNVEYSPTWTSPGRQGQRIDSAHAIFIHLAYNTLCFM